MAIDIYIKERNGSREIRIPVLPEKISVSTGGTVRASYDIMDKGPVEIPTGSGLRGIKFESFFPGVAGTAHLQKNGKGRQVLVVAGGTEAGLTHQIPFFLTEQCL